MYGWYPFGNVFPDNDQARRVGAVMSPTLNAVLITAGRSLFRTAKSRTFSSTVGMARSSRVLASLRDRHLALP
jgi:hypothetical protein